MILSYFMTKFVKIESHLHGWKNRSTFAQWGGGGGGGGGCHPLSTLSLSNFRAQDGSSDLKNFFMDKCPKDEPTGKNLVCRESSFQF